jgi:hypothetical protein
MGSLLFAPEEQHVYRLGPLEMIRSVRSDMPSVLVHRTPTERHIVTWRKAINMLLLRSKALVDRCLDISSSHAEDSFCRGFGFKR